MKRLTFFPILVAGYLVWHSLAAVAPGQATAKAVDFNRDIRPILSDNCFTCHGPDDKQRQANLRLDINEGLSADRGGYRIISSGDASKSRLFQRISAEDKAARMPPPWLGRTLTDQQIELIRRWIDQGAQWVTHWAYLPPRRPQLPKVKNTRWPRNAVDYFVLARLESEGLKPSPEADKTALIRRVTLDLTGLPPTPAEVDAFLKNKSPNPYEKVVDRLLASPAYGERMAARWLDAARYADTNGYQTDGERSMWRWRDWVIEAFNRNMPFDQFTIEQIAGDMLPDAALEQKIATGFNRNHRGNGEGGIIPEEFAVEYVADRVETTATVWLGLTLGCARCHNHKYDPFTQKEFYRVFAYFNNVPERGRANKYGNSPPMIKAPTRQQQAQLMELDRKVAAAEEELARLQPELAKAQREWEKSVDASKKVDWSMPWGLVAHYSLDGDLASTTPLTTPNGKPIEARWLEGEASFVPGRIGQAASFDGKRFVDAGDVANFGFYNKFTFAAWVYPTSPSGAILTRTQDTAEGEGFGLYLKEGKVQANLVKRWLDDALRVETESSLELNRWHHVMMTYDGSREATGVNVYINGNLQKLRVLLDELNQSFDVKEPLRVGAGSGPENRFRGSIDDVHVYNVALTPDQAAVLATPESVTEITAIDPQRRSKAHADRITWYFLEKHAPEPIHQAWERWLDLKKQREQFIESLPTVMVMQEREKPRETFVLIRGQYDKPGEKVSPGVPAILPPLPRGAPNNRLGFGRWLVDVSNPLTARVTVNRFWQMYFGVGLVKTAENFGVQGEPPSHPELLDWLATEFIRTGWDVKRMQKTIVMSATYRQSSKVTRELLEKDPENRLLARGPRLRLPAEMTRDQALAIAGLLVEKIGGPPVKPYQPAGLWKELSDEDYTQDKGENLYRRSLYTFWKRTVPPPAMMVFDAAGRETCVVRETRTNTPLQALNLMDDVTYVEASRVLAERMMNEGGKTPSERIRFAFRLAVARRPRPKESSILLDDFHNYLNNYQSDRGAALRFVSQGERPRDEKLDTSELAAYTAVASLILNLDETVTKQ